jgi:hypothetical protein
MTPLSLMLNERPDVRVFPCDATWYEVPQKLALFDNGAFGMVFGGMLLMLLPGHYFALYTPHRPVTDPSRRTREATPARGRSQRINIFFMFNQ